MSAYALNKKEIALKHLKKLDSLYVLTNHIEPEFRKAYEILINVSSIENNLIDELKYVNRLLKIDSLLTKDYKYISKNIYKKYDSPRLLDNKQRIIDNIEKEKKTSNRFLLLSIMCVILLLFIILYYFLENRKNKKRFRTLLEDNNLNNNKPIIEKTSNRSSSLNINQEVLDELLKKILEFEKNSEYIKPDITLNKLAKKFGTNTKYLSQVINHYREKTFTNYINSLRINYAVNELKLNSSYSKYTLKAIASEFGFNSTESFSSAFYKNTGVKLSYFIKELRK